MDRRRAALQQRRYRQIRQQTVLSGPTIPGRQDLVALWEIKGGVLQPDSIGLSTKKVSISGTGQIEADYIVPLNMHHGSEDGTPDASDVFMGGKSLTDFSDIGFYSNAGTVLPHYIASHGNHELIFKNTKTGAHNIIRNGAIYSSAVPGLPDLVRKSLDNGETWAAISSEGMDLLFIDSRGYLYGYQYTTKKVFRSIDEENWTVVLNMSAVNGAVQWMAIDEDANGNLFIGQYQVPGPAVIRRSIDGGGSFPVVWSDATATHIHSLGVDPYTGYIYAGVDGPAKLIRSTDGGGSFAAIWTNLAADITDVYCGDGFRLFGTGAGGAGEGYGIIRTTDDVTFTNVFPQGQPFMNIQELNGAIFAFSTSYAKDRYVKAVKSTDLGLTWETVWMSHLPDASSFNGWEFVTAAGTPNGSENQLLLGANNQNGLVTYPHARLFNGGDHYQALVYVKIPELPADGMDVYVLYGEELSSSNTIFPMPIPTGSIARWKIDEQTGTAIADSSGNGKVGVLTAGSGSWQSQSLQKAGSFYPPIKNQSGSYNFSASFIEITGSGTDAVFQGIKGKTVLAWVKSSYVAASQHIIGKGHGLSYYGLYIAATTGQLGFRYANGSTLGAVVSGPLQGNTTIADGADHLVGVSIDNSTPANVILFIDGIAYGPVALDFDYNPPTTNRAVRIGAKTDGGDPFNGRINDVIYYDSNLTELQVRSIYEGRPVSATAPGIASIDDYTRSLIESSPGVFEWRTDPKLIAVIGLNNAVYNADATAKTFASRDLALAALATLADDTYLFVGTKAAALFSVDMSAEAVQIKRYVGD